MNPMQAYFTELLKSSKEFFDRSTRPLTDEHSAYKPAEAMFSVVQQIAHTAQTVEWFFDGAFSPAGFDLDFEKGMREMSAVETVSEARAWLDRACARAIKEVSEKPWEEWETNMPDNPIMGPHPRYTILGGLLDHTAHHRGALTVYTRQLGLVPPMPYMEM
jgi:uncharacterized damage-inducible protein DinB